MQNTFSSLLRENVYQMLVNIKHVLGLYKPVNLLVSGKCLVFSLSFLYLFFYSIL